jgi:hypothetical protein
MTGASLLCRIGPWYVSAIFVIGVALVATSIAGGLKLRLIDAETQRQQDKHRVRINFRGDAAAHL